MSEGAREGKMKKIKVIRVAQGAEDKYRSHIKRLRRERDQLAEEVANQAQCNYAREPKFVKDRWRLRQLSGEVAQLLRQINRPLGPIVSKLQQTQRELAGAARELELESEMVIKRFEERERECDQKEPQELSQEQTVEGSEKGDDVSGGSDQQVKSNKNQHNGNEHGLLEEFIGDYVQARKRVHAKQTLANRLSSELACYESSWKSFATKSTSSATSTKTNTSPGEGTTTGCRRSPIRRGKQRER